MLPEFGAVLTLVRFLPKCAHEIECHVLPSSPAVRNANATTHCQIQPFLLFVPSVCFDVKYFLIKKTAESRKWKWKWKSKRE